MYLNGFAPTYKLPTVEKEEVYKNFVLTGDSYGACVELKACLSFQVLSDGSFRAIYDSTGEKYAIEGKITRILHKEIAKVFTKELLTTQSVKNNELGCRYGKDDTNWRFTVNYNDEVYTLNTCGSNIDYEGPTWDYLKKMVNFINTYEQ